MAVTNESKVGLLFTGGTIFAGVNAEGFRNAETSTDLVDFIGREFPDLVQKISSPAIVAYTGLSENIDINVVRQIRGAVIDLFERPDVKSVAITHGSDFPEVTGSFLDQDREVKRLLRERHGGIYITYSNDPYPAEEARMNLRATILEAASTHREPGVYISTENGVIPITGARKETYVGRPMRFFDYNDPTQKAAEDARRFDVFVTTNELAQNLGYSGVFELIGRTLPKPYEHAEHSGQWVDTTPGPYKSPWLERSTEKLSKEDAWKAAILAHALNRDLITPFPGFKAAFWPVNRPTDPFNTEMVIQGFFPDFKASLLILNHSSTAHTLTPDLSIPAAVTRMRIERNITTFAVTENGEPTRFGEGSYVTSKDLRDVGVIPLPMHSKVVWVKMWAAMDKGLTGVDLVDFMVTPKHPNEFTGELDQESVRYARSLIAATPIRELRRPGYGTGYLVVPKSKWDSVRTEPRRI